MTLISTSVRHSLTLRLPTYLGTQLIVFIIFTVVFIYTCIKGKAFYLLHVYFVHVYLVTYFNAYPSGPTKNLKLYIQIM